MSTGMPAIAEQIWNDKYRLVRQNGEIIDKTPSDTWSRIARALAETEKEYAIVDQARIEEVYQDFFGIMDKGYFSPAGRIIAGAGSNRRVTLSNCFTMGTIPDSMDGIFSMLKEAALTMQAGGGIGYDFSTLRPKNAPVKQVEADASGPLTFMDVWDAMCRTVMSAGSRRGAMMATMRCDHPDIFDFVEAKSDPQRLRMFNLSVLVTDEFMTAVYNDAPFRLHFEDRHGSTMVEREVKARDLWNKIMRSTYDYAEPGVIFIDRVNRDHNLSYLETIATTNPCGEKPMGPYASCLLGSVNVARLVLNPFTPDAQLDMAMLRGVVRTAIRLMDNVIETGFFPLEAQKRKAQQDRQLGLGVFGLANALFMLGIRYGSDVAVKKTESIMRVIAEEAYSASINLAKERGPFPTFDAEKFLEGNNFAAKTLPPHLRNAARQHGIRNGLLLSVAPTGTISLYAGNVSSGIEPVFAAGYTRKVLEKDGTKREERVEDYGVARYREFWESFTMASDFEEFDPDKHLPDSYVDAQTLSPNEHVRMQAAAQKWVDSSISKTVNVPKDISFEDFKQVYLDAYESGCKGCTTYRPNEITGSILSVDEKPEPVDRDAFLNEVRRLHGLNHAEIGRTTSIAHLRNLIDAYGVEKASELDPSKYEDFLSEIPLVDEAPSIEVDEAPSIEVEANAHEWEADAAEEFYEGRKTSRPEALTAPYGDQLPERPEALAGVTYKIKVGDQKAVYLTVNDTVEADGSRRPFEIFLRSSDPTHDEWMVAIARTVSAVMRRPYGARFIAEDFRRIHSPVTGGFARGAGYQPSLMAAIGTKLLEHMDAQHRVVELPDVISAMLDSAKAAFPTGRDMLNAVHVGGCPKCSSYNVQHAGGCPTCMDCGWSKCS